MLKTLLKKNAANFTVYPLLWLAVCFILGILTARYFVFRWEISVASCLIFAVLAAVYLKKRISAIFVCAAFLCTGTLCFQISSQNLSDHRIKKIYDENLIESNAPVALEGVLRGRPELTAAGFFLIVDAENLTFKDETRKVSGRVKLFAAAPNDEMTGEYQSLDLQYGSKIRVFCRLQREDNFLNPGVIPQKELLDQQEIDAAGLIKSPLLMEKIEDREIFLPLAWIFEQRQNLIVEFRNKFSVSTAGVLIASLLGDKYFLDKQTAKVFREGGTFHILVISGLHITFIGALILLFLRFFTKNKLWQFILAAAFLWLYALAVGAEVPVVRAALMFTILLFSQVIYRSGTLLNALGACALVLLIRQPDDLFTSSFQLTFASVGAIVAAGFPLVENLRSIGGWSPSSDNPFPPNVSARLKRVCETFYWREDVWKIEKNRQIWSAKLFKNQYKIVLRTIDFQKIAAYLFEALIISLIAQICLLPLTVIYFHRISPGAVFFNLWSGIFIALETLTAVLAVFLAQASEILALPLIKLTELFNWLLLSAPKVFVENDWSSFRLPAYPGTARAIYILYFAPILVITIFLNRWRPFDLISQFRSVYAGHFLKAACVSALLFPAVIIFHPFSAAPPDGKLHVDYLDVGQGDSALVTFPNGETMLIDGGGKTNFNRKYVKNETDDEPEYFAPDSQTIGESVVSPFLWSKGLDKIDYILASHADTDHIQGLTAVAENFRVRAAFFGRTPIKDEDFAELYDVLQKKQIPFVRLSRGDVLNFDGVKVEVLYPEKDDSFDSVSDNNHSLVLRIIYGNKKFLFTGDIEKEAESAILENPAFLRADFVKVAHHGSHTSSTQAFIDASKAEYAIISVGRTSPFGHPHQEIVDRWINAGAKIYRTGERGTISVSTDGKNLEIQTFEP